MNTAPLPWAAVLGLLTNAMVWGLSWWPMRQLQAAGLHPLWATVLIFTVSIAVLGLSRRGAWAQLGRERSLWWIVLAAGSTNVCFNWGVTEGDVVRVVLLFYLMPLWAVVLARLLLQEPVTRMALLRVALALAGAALVLWPVEGDPLSGFQAIDALGLLGGLSFALNNVLLRREAHRSDRSDQGGRGLAMFVGGWLVSLVLAWGLGVPSPPAPALGWVALAVGLSLLFLLGNLALQYGASRLPANATAVIMLTEVVWAAGSAVWLGAGQLSPTLLLGGGLIVGASLLAALRR